MTTRLWRKAGLVGLFLAVVTAIISLVWSSRGGKDPYAGLLAGLFALIAFVVGGAISAAFLISRSHKYNHKARAIGLIIIIVAAVITVLVLTRWI